MKFLRWLDIPPVWLVVALVIAKRLSVAKPFGLSFGVNWLGLPAGMLVGAGIILMMLAVIEMRKYKTLSCRIWRRIVL